MTGLSNEDRAQVKAILLTHAEMQDHRVMQGEEMLSRLKRDDPGNELIDDLEEDAADLLEDTENLKRIASHF